jgi:WD40 repeat protein
MTSYIATIRAADLSWASSQITTANNLLAACKPELRDWEHRHLSHVFSKGHTDLPVDKLGYIAPGFFPDGKHAVTSDGSVFRIWKVDTQEILKEIPANIVQSQFYSTAISRDGHYFASTITDNAVCVWNPNTGDLIHTLRGHTEQVRSVTFSSDSMRLITAGDDDRVRIWDISTGNELEAVRVHFSPSSAVLSPSKTSIWTIVSGYSGISCIDISTAKPTPLPTQSQAIGQIQLSPQNDTIAIPTLGASIAVFDERSRTPKLYTRGYDGLLSSVVYSPDGKAILGAAHDRNIYEWDLASGQQTSVYRGHSNSVEGLAISPDGHRVLSSETHYANKAPRLIMWERRKDDKLFQSTDFSTLVVPKLVTGGFHRTVDIDPQGEKLLSQTFGHKEREAMVDLLYTIDIKDNSIQALDRRSGELGDISKLVFSSDGAMIAGCSGKSNEIVAWNAKTGELIKTFTGLDGKALALTFSSDGKMLASVGGDLAIRIWSTKTGSMTRAFRVLDEKHLELPEHRRARIWSIKFCPSGKQIASVGSDGHLRAWDVSSGKPVFASEADVGRGVTNTVYTMSYTKDGNFIVTGGTDRKVKIWRASNGEFVREMIGHERPVTCLAINDTGTRIVSCDRHTTRIWDFESGKEVYQLRQGELHPVDRVVWVAGGRTIAGFDDNHGECQLWEAH